MNTPRFMVDPSVYFAGAYDQFALFGGPSTYFHVECIRASREAFLSKRHVEMLYATLASWGMHRMGDTETTKTRLTDWDEFHGSLVAKADELQRFRPLKMLKLSVDDYSSAVLQLRPYYEGLRLSVSNATIVVNSKAFHHLFPDFIPPIDRQYTIRFFGKLPEHWLDQKGKFRMISLPDGIDAQFHLFHKTCVNMKRLADCIEALFFEGELRLHDVAAPKALDNAIVNYVRIVSGQLRDELLAKTATR